LGVYGELGPRVGGTGFGTGATISQSLDYNFASKSFSTSTSFGVYGSLGLFNAGGNATYSYGKNGGWDWNVSAGVNLFGNDQHGVGLNIGYGSGGWTFGIGGYYDSHALDGYPIYNPEEWNNDEHILSMTNCYIYALNDKNMNDRGPVFGYFNEKGKFVTTKMSTEDVINSPQ
jgi:hypothetical protein